MKLWDCWNIPSMYEGRASSRAACWNIPFMYEFRPWRIWRQPLGRGMSPCCRRPSGHGRQRAWQQPLVSGVPPRCGQPSGPGAFGANRRATRRHSVAASRGRHSIGAICPPAAGATASLAAVGPPTIGPHRVCRQAAGRGCCRSYICPTRIRGSCPRYLSSRLRVRGIGVAGI